MGINKKEDKPIIETRWYKIVLAIFFVTMFYYGTYNGLQKTITIWSRPRYTVATFLGISKNFRMANHSLKYEYYHNGDRVEDYLSLPKEWIEKAKIQHNGGKYIVVYDSLRYKSSELLYECGQLSDTLVAPENGWITPPIPWCDKRYQLYDSSVWYNWVLCKTLDILHIEVKPKEP